MRHTIVSNAIYGNFDHLPHEVLTDEARGTVLAYKLILRKAHADPAGDGGSEWWIHKGGMFVCENVTEPQPCVLEPNQVTEWGVRCGVPVGEEDEVPTVCAAQAFAVKTSEINVPRAHDSLEITEVRKCKVGRYALARKCAVSIEK